MDQQIKRRGPSQAMINAEKYFSRYPQTSGTELARMFGLDRTTIHASDFWRAAKAKQSKVQA